MQNCLDIVLSHQLLRELLCVVLSKVRSAGKDTPTESALPNLLRCQGKDPEQLHHYFDQYLTHSGGNLSENFETMKIMFETIEEFDQCVVACADTFCRLKDLNVTTGNTT